MPFLKYAIVMLPLLLAGCAGPSPGQPHPYEDYLNQKDLRLPDTDKLQHCSSYGCAVRHDVSLTRKEWSKVAAIVKNKKTPLAERKALSSAIGEMEKIVGKKTGTDTDVAGTFDKTGRGQLDCVDESTNTTQYIAMMEKRKLLKFHTVSGPQSRTPFSTLGRGIVWPHQTAVIMDKKSGEFYAVDSWFRDNGAPADIVPFTEWKSGWSPDDATTKLAVVQ